MDHGKSTLVRALTGTDPDRFAEEKARGLTIDLGFGSALLPSGRELSIIDVPGHERFIRNMLAGVGAVDACMFVVAANEGWMPQTEEHLRILELVGLAHGIVVLTKTAICDEEEIAAARLEIADKVAGTFLANVPMIATDAVAAEGIVELRAELDNLCNRTPAAADHQRPRLWIDRAFAVQGAGTVVTGTLGGGQLHSEDELLLLPNNIAVRVRALQSHHQQCSKIAPGNRVAVNLAGVAHQDVARGYVLVKPKQWHLTNRFDASLMVLAALTHQVSRRGAYVIHVGACELPAQMRILGPQTLAPGACGPVRLHLQRCLPLLPGDRFVLRESGRGETIGGGTVLDVDPILSASKARPDLCPDRIVAERGWVEVTQLELLTGHTHTPTVGRWLVSPEALQQTKAELRQAVVDANSIGLDVAILSPRQRAVLDLLPEVVIQGGRARHVQQADAIESHPYIAALEGALFAPPAPETAGISRSEAQVLVKRRLAIEQNGVFFAAKAVATAKVVLGEMLSAQPEGVTVAEVRQRLNTSRKYALALLVWLDANGITRRRGDLRIAGPRL